MSNSSGSAICHSPNCESESAIYTQSRSAVCRCDDDGRSIDAACKKCDRIMLQRRQRQSISDESIIHQQSSGHQSTINQTKQIINHIIDTIQTTHLWYINQSDFIQIQQSTSTNKSMNKYFANRANNRHHHNPRVKVINQIHPPSMTRNK